MAKYKTLVIAFINNISYCISALTTKSSGMNPNGQLTITNNAHFLARSIQNLVEAGNTHFTENACDSDDVWVISEDTVEQQLTSQGMQRLIRCTNIVCGYTMLWPLTDEVFAVEAHVELRNPTK